MKTISNVNLSCKVEIISPELATKYLKANDNIRNKKPVKIRQMVTDILSDEWEPGAGAIRWSREPDGSEKLRDGQNTLEAIIGAKRSVQCVVIRGMTSTYYVDQGEKRSLSQYLKHEGVPYSTQVASAVSVITHYNILKTGLRSLGRNISHSDRMRTFRQYEKDLLKWVPQVHNRTKYWRGQTAAVLTLAPNVRGYAAAKDDFMECLNSGRLHDAALDSNDACWVLRETINKHRTRQHQLSQAIRLAFVIKCWNYHRRQELLPSPHLRWLETGPHKEEFPKIDGLRD